MGKRIALFCDGTWNDPNSRTNVHLLFQSAEASAAQCKFYFSGVGVEHERILGGLFGAGLDRILRAAYEKLCGAYEVGDSIYVFGFSRGAYLARSLAGLVRNCGILRREMVEARAGEAMALYRRREREGPDAPAAAAFRRNYAAAYYSADLAGKPAHPDFADRMLGFAYLGILETIGALGVPERIPFSSWFNTRYRFHDCGLSSFVERARHAVAIDETRNALPSTIWTQASIDALNERHGAGRAQQVWFPGDHSACGGGDYQGLSGLALFWLMQGAEAAGLRFDRDHACLAEAKQANAVTGRLRSGGNDNFWLIVQGSGPRLQGAPRRLEDLSDGARQRSREDQTYLCGPDSEDMRWRRATLAGVLEALARERG